jgi:oxygen-independent coproporphyrinogen-3 oxidase
MMCLRLSEGIDMDRHARLSGKPLDPSAITRLEDLGMVARTGRQLHATQNGRMILNAVIRELLE